MLQDQRSEKIVQFVNERGFAKISEIIDICNVSKPTILRDLIKLEEQGLIMRTHGGAKSIHKGTTFEPRHSWKENQNWDNKEKIALLAKETIEPGDTILLDSGSTTLMLAQQLLQMRNITVITNDIKVAMCLCGNEEIELVVLGGQRRKGVYSLIGPFAENMLNQLNVDKVFLGTDAIDLKKGLTNSNIEESSIKKTIINTSKQIILLADSSKFNNVAFVKISDIEALHMIVTDAGILEMDVLEELKEKKVEVRIANSPYEPETMKGTGKGV